MTRLWTKKQTQKTIKALRNSGYNVVLKSKGFYECKDLDGNIFTALIGTNGYIVRFREGLFFFKK